MEATSERYQYLRTFKLWYSNTTGRVEYTFARIPRNEKNIFLGLCLTNAIRMAAVERCLHTHSHAHRKCIHPYLLPLESYVWASACCVFITRSSHTVLNDWHKHNEKLLWRKRCCGIANVIFIRFQISEKYYWNVLFMSDNLKKGIFISWHKIKLNSIKKIKTKKE